MFSIFHGGIYGHVDLPSIQPLRDADNLTAGVLAWLVGGSEGRARWWDRKSNQGNTAGGGGTTMLLKENRQKKTIFSGRRGPRYLQLGSRWSENDKRKNPKP